MSLNLAGANASELFSAAGVGADPFGPYTNTGGAGAGATLTLTTADDDVVVTEAAGAFSGAGNPIVVDLVGPGEFSFLGANAYTGGTKISGGELSIANASALGSGALTFAGYDAILQSTVDATLANSLTLNDRAAAIIEVAAGRTLNLAGAFASVGGDDAALEFGSATDTGLIELTPASTPSVQGDRAVVIEGGEVRLGDSQAATLVGGLGGALTVGFNAVNATLDLDGQNLTADDLGGSLGGVITNSGAAATLQIDNAVNSTYAGVIENGAGALALTVTGFNGTALILTGASAYTGGTTIEAGQTLELGAGGPGGSITGAVIDNGGLVFDHDDDVTFGGVISGAGAVTQEGTGELTLTGDDSFAAGVTIDSGELSIGFITALGRGQVTFAGDDTMLEAQASGALANAIMIAEGVTVTLGAAAGNDLTLGAGSAFTDNGGGGATLHFGSAVDTGTVDLSLTGATTQQAGGAGSIDGGELFVGGRTAETFLADMSRLTVGDNEATATLEMNGLAVVAQNLLGASDGVIVDDGAAATLTLVSAVNSAFSGKIANGTGVISLVVDAFGGAELQLNGVGAFSGGTTINSGWVSIGNITALGSGSLTFAGNGGGLQATATGTLANTPITIAAGVSATISATLGHDLTLAPATFIDDGGAGATLHFGSAVNSGVVTLAPTSLGDVDPAGAASIDGGTLVVGDTIGASILSRLDGGLTVGSGIRAATLDLDGHSVTAHDLSGASPGVITDSGAAATLTADDAVNVTYAGVISGSDDDVVSLGVEGVGTLTLLGDDSYFGGTTIASGRLELGQDTSAGVGAITFSSGAFATLALLAGVDPSIGIAMPDATDAIDFEGIAYAFGDKLAAVNPGYALETATGAALATVELEGAFDDSALIAGPDGARGTQIAAPYTAQAASASAKLSASAARILLRDSAAHIAAQAAAVTSLIADGRVAALFTSDASLVDGSSLVLGVIGGGDTIDFANSSDDAVSLYDTAGASDAISGSRGEVDLTSATARIAGGGDRVDFLGGSGNSATLSGTNGDWDFVIASQGTINLTSADASIVGGGDAIDCSGSSAVSLYATGGSWDTLDGSADVVYLSSAQASIIGGGDTIVGAGASKVSLYDTGATWDFVNGSGMTIFLTDARTSVAGGGDTINLAQAPDDQLSLYATNGDWDLVGGSGGTIYLTDAQASVVGGDETLRLLGTTGNEASLFDTAGAWDAVVGANASIFLTSAQASVFGGADTLFFWAGQGDAASLYNTQGQADTINGASGTIYLTNAATAVNGGGDTIDLLGAGGNVANLAATAGVADKVNGSHATIGLAAAQATAKGSDDTFDLSGASTLTMNGDDELLAFAQSIGGLEAVNGYVSSDTFQFSKNDFANFTALRADLGQSGANAVLTLDAKDAVTFAGVLASGLKSSQFTFV